MLNEHKWTIEAAEEGARLDRWLADRLGVSRKLASRLLEVGALSIDGRCARRRSEELRPGMRVEIDAPLLRAETCVEPRPDLDLRMLEENQDWIAIDKPSGAAVHPLDGEQTATLLNAVIARFPEIEGVGEGGLRSGVVHRLDVPTSGVLLFARTQNGFERLRAAFAEHRMEKIYHAVVRGRLTAERTVEVPLAVTRHRPARVEIVSEDAGLSGQYLCATRIRPVETGDGWTLVEARPRTGYLHQIRVTLAHLGHPIVGDSVYEGPPAARLGLHASSLKAPNLSVESPQPVDFQSLMK